MADSIAILEKAEADIASMMENGEITQQKLAKQRETMMRIKGNAVAVSSTVDQGRAVTQTMLLRVSHEKVAIGVFLVLLLIVIIGLIVGLSMRKQ